MSDTSGSKPDPERMDEQQPQPESRKVKAENEKITDKLLKREMEKAAKRELKETKNEFKELKSEKLEKNELKESQNEFKEPKLEKREKFEKNEAKELKSEKFEKNETKELKNEKLEKNELKEFKNEKLESKEGKVEFEKPASEGRPMPEEDPLPIERERLAEHADALENAARQLRHFIEQSERPDLRRGALKNEPDQEGGERQ